MVVAFLHSGPNVPGINLYLNRRVARALRIKLQRAMNILEVSSDVGHHHVPGAELSGGVSRLKTPFSHRSFSFDISGALQEYPGKVLPLTVEDSQPQDRYHSCESRSTMIQEDVITND